MFFIILFFTFFIKIYTEDKIDIFFEKSNNLSFEQIKTVMKDLKTYQDYFLLKEKKIESVKGVENSEIAQFENVFKKFKDENFLKICNLKLNMYEDFILRFFDKNNFNINKDNFALDFLKNNKKIKSLYVKRNKDSLTQKEYCGFDELLDLNNKTKEKEITNEARIRELFYENFKSYKNKIEEYDKKVTLFYSKEYTLTVDNQNKMSIDEIFSNFYIDQLIYNFCFSKNKNQENIQIEKEEKNKLIKIINFLTGKKYTENDISLYIDDFLKFNNNTKYKNEIVLGTGTTDENTYKYISDFKDYLKKEGRKFTFLKIYEPSIKITSFLLPEEYSYGKFLDSIRLNILSRFSK